MIAKFTKKLTVAAVTATLALSSVGHAYVLEVNDGSANMQRGMQFAQKMAEMGKQLTQMKNQVSELKKQYAAITGSRGMGNFANNPAIRDALPKNWQKVYDNIQKGGYKGLDGTAAAIADAAKLVEKCQYITNENAKKACEAQAVHTAQMKSDLMTAFDNASKRLTQIEQLMQRIDSATDAKAIADLQARIQVEQAKIQNEQTRIQLYKMIQEENQKLLAHQTLQSQREAMENYRKNMEKGK